MSRAAIQVPAKDRLVSIGLGADVFVDAVGVVITWVDIVVSDFDRSSKPHTTCLTQIVANS